MKSTRWMTAALAALVAVSLALGAAGSAVAQGDLFEQLRKHDFQSGVGLLRPAIAAALADKARHAEIEKGLISVLQDPSATFAGKQEACRMLWVIGTGQSVPVLAKMLTDEKLGNIARYALERNADPSAGKALRAALATTKGRALVGVINSVGDRGDAQAVAALKKLSASKEALVSGAAIAALGKVGTESALAVLQGMPAQSLPVCQATLRCAERLAAAGKKAQAERAYASLAQTGRPSVARGAALRGLAALKSPRAGALALAFLKSADPYLQRQAAQVCGSALDAKTLQSGLALWPRLPAATQTVLLTALVDRRAPEAGPLALRSLGSQDDLLRATAIRAAARLGGASAVTRLVELASRGEGADRGIAREALASAPGKAAEQALLQTAMQGQPETRAALMSILAERPTPGAVNALLASARGADPRVAVEALRSLGRVGGPATYPELLKVLASTQDDAVRDAAREAAVAVAQRMEDRNGATASMLAALGSASVPTKAALLSALANLGGDQALEQIIEATKDPNDEVRRAAVLALADSWGDARPMDTLQSIARNDSNRALRVFALRGYLRMIGLDDRMTADEKVQSLAQALTLAERPEEKRQVLSVLRDCRVPSALDLSAKLLDDPDVFAEAADTILYLAGPQRKNNRRQAAVQGASTNAALDKVIQMTKDDSQRAQAEKLKG